MISKRTSDEKLKKRLEQALRANIKKRKSQKQMRDCKETEQNNNQLVADDQVLIKSSS
jgi:hypothetical protein